MPKITQPSRTVASRRPVRIGYQLSSEEHRPNDLVKYAQLAEEHGFSFAS